MYFFAVLAAVVTAVPTPAPSPALPPVPNVAPGYAAPTLTLPAPVQVGVTQQPFVGITLETAIGMALKQNTQLQIAQANRRVAGYQVVAAKGAYDIDFSVEPQYQYVTQPPQNAFFAGPNFGPIEQRNTGVAAGFQGMLPGGQTYSVSASGRQTYDNTTINSFDPYYPTVFSVNFTQPLGRGRTMNQASESLQLAEINAAGLDQQSLAQISSTIADVEDTYWDLVAAWRNVAIQEEALRDTIAQQHGNVREARSGAIAPVDVVQTDNQIAVFAQNVYSALTNVATLQNRLKSLLLSNPNDPTWNANLVPTTPVLQLPAQPSLAALVVEALRDRPEIAQVRDAIRSAQVGVSYADEQTKPQVNLQLGYTSNGFAGDPTNPLNSSFAQSSAAQTTAIDQLIAAVNQTLPASAAHIPALPNSNTPIPSYLQGGLDQSIKNLLSNKFPVYSAGIQVVLPIGNTTAKADLAAAQERLRAAQLQEIDTIQSVTADVRDALQAYIGAQAQLSAARTARVTSEQILASEKRRFRAGASTTFLVLQREIELADDRGLELQAQTALNKAVVGLERATGTILSQNDVSLTK